jgi:hypothetical protein
LGGKYDLLSKAERLTRNKSVTSKEQCAMNESLAGRAAIAALVLAVAAPRIASADPISTKPSVKTPALQRTEMRDWLADGERGIWIQMRSLKWFYARLTARCPGLDSTNSLGFGTGASVRLERMTSVLVPGHGSCGVRGLVPSGGPAKDRNVKVVLQPQTQ